MLFRKTVAVYCENHMEHTNTLCGQNAEYVKAGGTYSPLGFKVLIFICRYNYIFHVNHQSSSLGTI
jgi:hypothetical protein